MVMCEYDGVTVVLSPPLHTPNTPTHTHTAPPVLIPSSSFFYASVNSIVVLNFTIQGAKPPVQVANITWRFNNGVINTDSPKYTQSVTPNGNLVRLTIRSLTLVDTGQYQAFVSHEARPEDITINLSVKCKCSTYTSGGSDCMTHRGDGVMGDGVIV